VALGFGLALGPLPVGGLTGVAAAAPTHPAESEKGAVAADHELASRAGAEILAQGGNAVDAAVATALALGVVQPSASGLGGGGFLVVRTKDGAIKVLDFRETAPGRAHRDMFLDEKTGQPVPERSRLGGLAVAVPGEPAGLAEALRTLGTMNLKQVSAPARRMAKEGFPVGRHLQRAAAWTLGRLPVGHPLRALLAPGEAPLQAGQVLRRPELSRTLERMAQDPQGLLSFYRGGAGGIGAEVVAAVQGAGGVMTAADLSGYKPVWREPLCGQYRGYRVCTVPPPAGGLVTLEALQVLAARTELPDGPGASSTLHYLTESFKHAFADRMRLLSDPAFVKVPVATRGSVEYAKRLAGRIKDDQVLPHSAYGWSGGAGEAPRDKGTTHLCVIDGAGNAAALTTTINLGFGAKLVAGSTGVLLNNEMDDFAAKPGTANAFGLVGSEANAVAPGKRPLSSMSPTLAIGPDGSVICAGGSGGPTIVTGTVQALVNVIDFKMDPQAAVAAPRVHAQYLPDHLTVEREVPKDVRDGLMRRGHKLQTAGGSGEGAVQVAARAPRSEKDPGKGAWVVSAGSDPRKDGLPATP
jgi:gamma-glutamyltranspeptidase/glutathione hydrolase